MHELIYIARLEKRFRGSRIELSTRYLSLADDIIRISFLSWDISSRDMHRTPFSTPTGRQHQQS